MSLTPAQRTVAVKRGLLKAPKTSGSKPVPSKRPTAFDPTNMTFKNQQDFEDSVKEQAMTQLNPQLSTIASNVNQDQAAHAQRERDLQGWGSWESDQLKSAFDSADKASNDLIAGTAAAGTGSADNLRASLASNTGAQNALATRLGGMPPPNQDAALLAAATASNDAGNRAASQIGGGLVSGAQQARSLAPVQANQLETTEQGRLKTLLDQAKLDRANVMTQLPDAETSARNSILQTLQGNRQLKDTEQNQEFQQYLAQAEFDDKVKQEGFAQWKAKQDVANAKANTLISGQQVANQASQYADTSKLNWAQLNLDQQKVTADINKVNADAQAAGATAAAKARGQQWNTGLTMLASYIGGFSANTAMVADPANPGKTISVKTDANGKPLADPNTPGGYVLAGPQQLPHYGDAYRILTGQARMSRHDALMVLAASQYPSWQAAAKKQLHLEGLKKSAEKPTKGTPTTTKKPPTTLNPKPKPKPVKKVFPMSNPK